MEKASWKPTQVLADNPATLKNNLSLSMTAKQPPLYDGRVSWLRYEELVDDWVTFTTIASKRGPLLKSRLTGYVHMHKAVLQNDLLQDPDAGVNYFKNKLKKFFLKGSTNVYLNTLLSFFNHRRQNAEFLIFTSKFHFLLMRLKAAWMDLMPAHTARSPEFIASVQEANARRFAAHPQAAGARAPPPDLLQTQSRSSTLQRHRDAFPLSDNLIAQFFIIQSELSDQQRERLLSAMSLRNISLENYTYEMMKMQYHDLFITTRTSIQPSGATPSTFSNKESMKAKKASGWKTKKDWKVLCQPTMRRPFGCWRRTMRSLRERCLGGISDSRREKEKENRQAKRAVTNEVASNPFEKVALAGRPIWPAKIRIPTTRHIGEKAKERRERK